jgi:tripartite-type tricarboxylate transporter receptor subunit TctC
VARLIERVMSQQLGQKIIVDNRPGANEFLGAEFVTSSPGDGYRRARIRLRALTRLPRLQDQDTRTCFLSLGTVPTLDTPEKNLR